MRVARGLVISLLLLPLGGMLAGCDTLESFQLFDSKKKLPGDRHPVFPNGVPGVTQGIPPELVKGYQEPQQQPDNPAAAAAAATAEKIEPPKPQPKPKPKPRTAAAPRPAPAPQPQAQQPAAQPAPAPWPSQPAPQGGGWPQSQ